MYVRIYLTSLNIAEMIFSTICSYRNDLVIATAILQQEYHTVYEMPIPLNTRTVYIKHSN